MALSSTISLISSLFIIFNILASIGSSSTTDATSNNKEVSIVIGAVVDDSSRIGKEEKTAMQLAEQEFNNVSKTRKISLSFLTSQGSPFVASSSAEKLVRDKDVKVLLGTGTWSETASIAYVGNRSQIPVISLSSSAIRPSLITPLRWPFLTQIATDSSSQVRCIVDIVRSYGWQKVTAIYEHDDDLYGGDLSGLLFTTLYEALKDFDSEIEYYLGLPPFSSLSNPKGFLKEEMTKLMRTQSRVFIVLKASLPMVSHLFEEAKRMELVEEESVWILGDNIADLLDNVGAPDIYFMEGALGIKTYYPETSSSYSEFHAQFRKMFKTEYPEEDNNEPGIHALRAYDCVRTVSQAIEKSNTNNITGKLLQKSIQTTNFDGLSGKIQFKEGVLLQNPLFRIVNVVGKKYRELDFWTPKKGFSSQLVGNNNDDSVSGRGFKLNGHVIWPGDLHRVPRGWALSKNGRVKMRIVLPEKPAFENFVNVESDKSYTGFCIELFNQSLEKLDYQLQYDFYTSDGTYDDLVQLVVNKVDFCLHMMGKKTYDAAVGDITITYNRSKEVEFTQPYTISGLSMIVPVKSEESAWMFVKPFTWEMWFLSSIILVYTMFVVWFMEHKSNEEFQGSRGDQISIILWFTFSSLFFAHKEKIHSNLTKVVVTVWLFVVFILTSSYTASLSSILTVQQMEPAPTIDWAKRNKIKVGCDKDSFVKKYLVEVLDFLPENIVDMENESDYRSGFQTNKIAAAFLELPYEKIFLSKYCNEYTSNRASYRFGGLGFVFEKGSPIAKDVSEAILQLLENGDLIALQNKWLTLSGPCSRANSTSIGSKSLNFKGFWGLFAISALTSTICLIVYLTQLHHENKPDNKNGDHNNDNEGIGIEMRPWDKARTAAGKVKYDRENGILSLNVVRKFSPTLARRPSVDNRSPSTWQSVNTSDNNDIDQSLASSSSSPKEIKIV